MLLKKIVLLLLLMVSSYAHKVAGVDMELEKVGDTQIKVKAFFQKSKKPLFGNEVRLISMLDNRVLTTGKLTREGLILNIPSESYWVYVIVRDNDIVKDGLAPTGGFQKAVKLEKRAFIYTALTTLFFLCLSGVIAYRKNKRFKQSLL